MIKGAAHRRRLAAAAAALLIGACTAGPGPPPAVHLAGGPTQPAPGGSVRDFTLTAAPLDVQLKPGLREHAWGYNGSVPGPTLRVRAGDLVRVTLRNRLPVGTTIHWHGLAVANGEDGVAGLTQQPVPPGADATYAFLATTAGTYWYHSHERGSEQVDRGLYGALVVDPAGGPAEADGVAVLDEWPLGRSMPNAPGRGDFNLETYTTYSVNGRTGPAIAPLSFTPGRPYRLRVVNAGYAVHLVHVDGATPAIAALDGHEVSGPPTSSAIPIAPGERVDLLWTPADQPAALRLEEGWPPADEVTLPLRPAGVAAGVLPPAAHHPVLDLYAYPAAAAEPAWPAGAAPTRTFDLHLGQSAAGGSMPGMGTMAGEAFTINGQAFPNTPDLVVSDGDLVELRIFNDSRVEHSIHLHGHVLQVLARNGAPVAGVLVKDTVLVLPGTSVVVGFRADNPGWWMLHCHQLYHSAAGMMAILRYSGAPRLAELGGSQDAYPD